MQEEIWKTTELLEGAYEVSSLGRIRRISPGQGATIGKILKTFKSKAGGYFIVQIRTPSKKNWTISIHRLVCEAFHGPRPPGKEVNHKNSDRLDNRPENLEWVSRTENIRHCAATGALSRGQYRRLKDPVERLKIVNRLRKRNAKLTGQDVIDILAALQHGQSVHDIATKYRVVYNTIWYIKTGKHWVTLR